MNAFLISRIRTVAAQMQIKANSGPIVRHDILSQAERLNALADELEENAKKQSMQPRLF